MLDFETGGKNPKVCPPIQIAAAVIDARRLELIPGAVYNSLMCPPPKDFDLIEDEALTVNGKTREQIKAAPPWELVWKEFSKFVLDYKIKSKLPIASGQNIINFDLIISERMCKLFGPWDKKGDRQGLFNPFQVLELSCYSFGWFENLDEPKSYSMDNLRAFLGISKEGGHDALKDVYDSAHIYIKFQKLMRSIAPKVKFKDSFKN